ncbi:ergothioneine biosynthesis protein EgtB [Legionella sp. MW5194]|uniref:ergothioneine biosynthesis protein EgtB n=1 Tax=Legionella sp. MW5194 TaxID=2662448 RepID=UPI00193E32D3|nr:ergothioneine biosynthesis protein EgtB [Legionella sp. MW5194]QRN02440.1 ergothioneine biosynthesis protein EgtB [Legionella sp. MW5194]
MEKEALCQALLTVRNTTETICEPLLTEDYVIQSMPDVSPPKWHLAHTSWFFETFLLTPHCKEYRLFNQAFGYLFNSYYQSIGKPYTRAQRGLLSRPTTETVYRYRRHVTDHLLDFIAQMPRQQLEELTPLLLLGFEHEQQHQELLFMDIKHNFFIHPDWPAYLSRRASGEKTSGERPLTFSESQGGVVNIGFGDDGFCFDNESPRHACLLKPYRLANRLITNGEYLEFIEAGGYQQPQWWLADGWDCVQANQWQAPLYWIKQDNTWQIYTLRGMAPLHADEPVAHVSYYEAEAYARFRDARLPREEEWEHFVVSKPLTPANGHFMEEGRFHPVHAERTEDPQQFFGDLWEWTASAFSPYPGYRNERGFLGEYNGKFMSNQMVLRGGSCITPQNHIRASYRNFFQPEKRWQFSGIRLAADNEG